MGKKAEYRYVRTAAELKKVLQQFKASGMKYLHISSHGNDEELVFTIDHIIYKEFVKISEPYLDNKRLFISACEVKNPVFASLLFSNTECLSLIGPKGTIKFNDAAIFWASFYNEIFKLNLDLMKRDEIREVLDRLCLAFNMSFRYYRPNDSTPYYKEEIICRKLRKTRINKSS